MIVQLSMGPLDPDQPNADYWSELMRAQRNALLQASDWTQTVDDPTGNAAAWATYRQQLRDAPAIWTPGPEWNAPEPPA